MSIDLFLSDRCSLQCKYCFNYETGKQGPDWSRTLRALNWYFSQEEATPGITVYGGEPTYEWDMVIKLVEWVKENPFKGNPHKISLITNLTLLNEERMQFIVDNNIALGNSVDGDKEAQDANRVFPDGAGSFSVVSKNIELLKKYRTLQGCRSTYSPNNVQHLFESVKYLKELGYQSISMVNESGARWTQEQLSILREQFKKLTDWAIEETKKNGGKAFPLFHIRNAKRTMQGILSGRRHGVCSINMRRIAVDTLDNIQVCHRFCNPRSPKEWVLGTLETGITNTKLLDAFKKFDFEKNVINKNPKCKNCLIQDGCWFTCWGEIVNDADWKITDDGIDVIYKDDWCEIRRLEYIEGRRAIIELAKLGIDAYPFDRKQNPKPSNTNHNCQKCKTK